MKYVIADKTLAFDVGFSLKTHHCSADKIILNEKEVLFNEGLRGTFEERASMLHGEIVNVEQAKQTISIWQKTTQRKAQ